MTAEPERPRAEIDRSIYVMPAFATLTVADLEVSKRWYADGLGLVVLAELPGLVHLRRWRYQDLLLVPSRAPAARSRHGAMRITFAAATDDLDAVARRATKVSGGTIDGPSPTRWNTVDLVARDPDGYEVVLTAIADQPSKDPAFSAAELRGAFDRARSSELEG